MQEIKAIKRTIKTTILQAIEIIGLNPCLERNTWALIRPFRAMSGQLGRHLGAMHHPFQAIKNAHLKINILGWLTTVFSEPQNVP
jgi:hypothetical protein